MMLLSLDEPLAHIMVAMHAELNKPVNFQLGEYTKEDL